MMKLGGTVIQNCAARGVETEGGRLSAVVTERGTIRTKIAILSGGAGLLLLPAARHPLSAGLHPVSIVAVSGAAGIPPALHTKDISVTARSNGDFTLSISGRARVDLTPQQLRFLPQFLPMFLKRWQLLSPGVSKA